MSIQAAALYALVGVTGAQQSVRDLQNVSNQVNKTQGVMSGLGKGAGQMATGVTQVGKGLLRIGEWAALAAGAAVGASAKIGTSFQATTELIHTQAGATQAEVDSMRTAIEGLVHSVGTSPQALAEGLYHIESVGLRGAAALDVLKASALGAKVGLADMDSVTNALTAVWFSGIKGAKSMTDAMAILDGIVGVGNMHLQDLTDSFKSGVLGTAATYSVDIRSLGAAIATLTDAGVPANIAATRLNMTLTHMAAPTAAAIKVLKGIGISQFELANDLRKPDGIFVALKDLHDHLVAAGELKNGILTPQGAADLSKIFGGSRFGATAMQLLTQMDRIDQKYTLINQRSQTFGQNVQATMETAGFVWGQFRADIENAALAFSEGFLPALARAGSKLDAFLVGHTADIRQLGVQLGQWLDKIDWQQVEKGANDFIGVLKTALDLISKIPPQVDAAVVGFLTLNKLSGGLLGAGVGNIVGGAAKGLESIAAGLLRGLIVKIPGIGGAIASVTAVHVFVDNWPLGFGLPGAAGGAVGAAEAGGVGIAATVLRLLPATAIAGAIVLAAVPIGQAFADALPAWLKGPGGSGKSQSQIAHEAADAAAAAAAGTPYPTGPAGNVTPNFSPFDLGKVGNLTPQISQLAAEMSGVGGTLKQERTVLDAIHRDFVNGLHSLAHELDPAKIIAETNKVVAAVEKGVGSSEHTKDAIVQLKAKLNDVHDPKAQAVLRAAIAKLEAKVPGREYVERQIAEAKKIASSTETTQRKVHDLKAIESNLLAHGDKHAANEIVKLIAIAANTLATALNIGSFTVTAQHHTNPSRTRPHPSSKPAPSKPSAPSTASNPYTQYAVGSWNVPTTGPAIVHAGEMIVPAREAGQIRDIRARVAAAIRAASQPGVVLRESLSVNATIPVTVNATTRVSLRDFSLNQQTISKMGGRDNS